MSQPAVDDAKAPASVQAAAPPLATPEDVTAIREDPAGAILALLHASSDCPVMVGNGSYEHAVLLADHLAPLIEGLVAKVADGWDEGREAEFRAGGRHAQPTNPYRPAPPLSRADQIIADNHARWAVSTCSNGCGYPMAEHLQGIWCPNKVCDSLAFGGDSSSDEHRCTRLVHMDLSCRDATHRWTRGRHPAVFPLADPAAAS